MAPVTCLIALSIHTIDELYVKNPQIGIRFVRLYPNHITREMS